MVIGPCATCHARERYCRSPPPNRRGCRVRERYCLRRARMRACKWSAQIASYRYTETQYSREGEMYCMYTYIRRRDVLYVHIQQRRRDVLYVHIQQRRKDTHTAEKERASSMHRLDEIHRRRDVLYVHIHMQRLIESLPDSCILSYPPQPPLIDESHPPQPLSSMSQIPSRTHPPSRSRAFYLPQAQPARTASSPKLPQELAHPPSASRTLFRP